MSERERARRRLMKGFRGPLRECEQAITDIEHWNQHRTEHPPVDPKWFQVQAAGLRKCLAALERDEPIDENWLQRS